MKVLLITNEERQLMKGMLTGRELNIFVGRKMITIPLDASNNIVKMDKLACIMEVVFSLDELNSTSNLENGNLNNILLRYHVIGSEEFTSFELVALQYKRHKNIEFASLTLRIMDQKDNGISHGLEMTIVLHIR